MTKLKLNGMWKLKDVKENVWLNSDVPGSVFNTLLNEGKIEDPFYRDNEDKAKEIALKDYEYERDFEISEELLKNDKLFLCCEGLDTLAEIKINGILVASTDNMHRTYEFDVKNILKLGLNSIHITLYSPIRYITEKNAVKPLMSPMDAMDGFTYMRKAHSMFGWDWGPKIPDSGIWRNIFIVGYKNARLSDVYVTQSHNIDQQLMSTTVSLDVRVRHENWSDEKLNILVKITSPDGKESVKKVETISLEEHICIKIENPEIWWPNGYGSQPLYNILVVLGKDGESLDSETFSIGLRTLNVKREKDQWGECFEFEVNGVSIFSMGADYIPEDNLLPRVNEARTELLIKDCIEANYNCIRVWGGGYYPDDYFFDLCDKYGLVVWQDFMFACGIYDLTDEFADNIEHEVHDNVKRLRHHASLGLWCGNNEQETAWANWGWPKVGKLRADYTKMYEYIIPSVVKEMDPNTFYWPSSPSSGGGFDEPNSYDKGDVHYWDVWHGLKPFTDYRKFYFRFCSEFGFQSFPSLKTVETFTLPEDRNIFSYVMEKHQKNGSANGKILYYLSENFKYPKDFDSLLYASQLLQAEAIKYGVEHWRRNRGRCMGAIYWQLNDCWPVASWASIDYFGRWKALHYFAKKFFAPVLLSASEEGTKVELHITNETMNLVNGKIIWKLCSNNSRVVKEGELLFTVDKLSAKMCKALDFSNILTDNAAMRENYLEYSLVVDEKIITTETVLFVKAKHFEFLNPNITLEVSELANEYIVTVKAENFAKYVELSLNNIDGRFDNNYFDISGGKSSERQFKINKLKLSEATTLESIKAELSARSIFDIS